MVVVSSFVSMAAGLLSMATFEFMVVPMQKDLGFSVDTANALILVPSAASLLIVFAAGSLADHLGKRRLLLWGVLVFCAGALLVMVAPNVPVALLGRSVGGVGGMVMGIVALAVLNSSVTDDRERARIFGVFAALTPAIFLVAPPISALLAQSAGWRAVPVMWLLLGAASMVLTLRYTPDDSGSGESTELVTPLLAGLFLASATVATAVIFGERWIAVSVIALAIAALVGLAIRWQRLAHPGLDLRVLRPRGSWLLIGAILLSSVANLFLFTNLFLQYRYDISLVAIALLMGVSQAAAVAGGLLGGTLIARWGAARTALTTMLLTGVTALGATLVTVDSPEWIPVVVLSVVAIPAAASVGALAKCLMDLAPADGSGGASSMNNAVWSLGSAVGGIVVGLIIFGSFEAALANNLVQVAVSPETAATLASEVREGSLFVEVMRNADLPATARGVFNGDHSVITAAQTHAYALVGIVIFVAQLAASGLMLAHIRRRR